MTLTHFLLILASVGCSALAQLLLKLGMSRPEVASAMNAGGALTVATSVAQSVPVIGGLALYAFGAVLWLFVLAKLDLSAAYPFVGLGFILTMILGWAALGESISASRLIGTALVLAGCVLVGKSV